MLDNIISFSLRNKIIVGLFTALLIIAGIHGITRLPIDALPDITNNQVQVITVSQSLAAPEVERLITFPVEQTMATIPGITEMRSFSRFGLSIVTIVFTDETDVYWARQQVNERLSQASGLIAPGVGKPELAPLTTGLGEIYQFILRPKKGFESKYNAMELRTIQDWIIRRQLLGTEGVAEVSNWGGVVKQYEIAIDPEKLRSMNVGINEIFTALEKNNQNAGGSYIDEKPFAYFIRSQGMVESLSDIENIVIRSNSSDLPVLIRDVAIVQFGNANRFGAMTDDDNGEVAGAIVLMLKGANSSLVIKNVKAKIVQIEKTLPAGVEIVPYLDRTKLVNNAVHTVTKNLAEGALIVVFVLVLMLGNIRAGLIVASVIPLALMFSIIMMNLFGVSGNLMSLGALDFGLIVDGAVIIVEATLHHLALPGVRKLLSQKDMDAEVQESSSRMMHSAAFGQIIILIVYLPILTLAGIEGKMFRPMAQTVSFAVVGALLLSLTYVPVVSALFLKNVRPDKITLADKIMSFVHRLYEPAIYFALRRRAAVVIGAFVFMALAVVLFFRLGGEFIPQLDEGDFAVDTRLLTGSSLTQSIEVARKSSKIILESFPEVKEVVSKIGNSEIPTDPMPIEAMDLILVLKERDEWTSATSREELADKISAVLHNKMPGVAYGFQQPIQMRFNELLTGARQDVVIKIFGEDLAALADYADRIGRIAHTVAGAEDIYVEPIGGLQQVTVKFNRVQLAKFGISIDDASRALRTGFSGDVAGLVFENEKRFDLVVRLQKNLRKSREDINRLYITDANGNQIRLEQIADIELKVGPNQIQREDAKRRITVGFNVRGRDVSSIVEEMDKKIAGQIHLEPGYYLTYGGSFKNLAQAKSRLYVAVPIALLLIFILLFFTFHSFRYSLLIYSAIPLSAIGGVVALWIRQMPFSISAGVGFVALFGVAVLNGIVLITEFNRLRKEGITDLTDIVVRGTHSRLRPVMMTALVASLGFLPMALSHSSGAEVQRPLATVVIGGLITATLLTLLVLPVLYTYFEKKDAHA